MMSPRDFCTPKWIPIAQGSTVKTFSTTWPMDKQVEVIRHLRYLRDECDITATRHAELVALIGKD